MTMRQRVRIRFRKQDDLRWISHRDLAAAMERLFRRAGLALVFSEGFHPKPRINFPLALAVGIEALHEIVEVELSETPIPEELLAQLREVALPGLTFTSVEVPAFSAGKAQARRAVYVFPTPAERAAAVGEAIERLRAQTELTVEREGKTLSLSLADVEELAWNGAGVRFALRFSGVASLRPREILAAVGVADLEYEGAVLTRVAVELADDPPT